MSLYRKNNQFNLFCSVQILFTDDPRFCAATPFETFSCFGKLETPMVRKTRQTSRRVKRQKSFIFDAKTNTKRIPKMNLE
jgi:hypothetical protein